jgi:hypothetical protein
MPIKVTLTEFEASDLAYIVNTCGTLTMVVKSRRYFENGMRCTFYPLIRVQSKKQDLHEYKERFGGSIYTDKRNGKVMWTWNNKMIKAYFPAMLEYLSDTQREKARIILKSLKYTHGMGNYQDFEELRKLYEQLKLLQMPRPRHIYPWDSDRTHFY